MSFNLAKIGFVAFAVCFLIRLLSLCHLGIIEMESLMYSRLCVYASVCEITFSLLIKMQIKSESNVKRKRRNESEKKKTKKQRHQPGELQINCISFRLRFHLLDCFHDAHSIRCSVLPTLICITTNLVFKSRKH